MRDAPLYSAAGARSASFALPQPYFDGTVHEPVLHQAVKTFLNNQRQGTAAVKTRRFVAGGNQKPWRQKGTGRARQGTIRAPHWRGGGIVFGPEPRDYRASLPAKVKQLARRSALNARAAEGALFVIEDLSFDAPKTGRLAELLEKLGLSGRKVLVLTSGIKPNLYLSGRNLPAAEVMPFSDASAYHVLWSDVVVVERSALGGGEPTAMAEGEEASPPPARKKAAKAKAPKAEKAPKAAKARAPKAAKAKAPKAAKKKAKKAAPKRAKKKGRE
jgi:large subunit ribosomal protein L4